MPFSGLVYKFGFMRLYRTSLFLLIPLFLFACPTPPSQDGTPQASGAQVSETPLPVDQLGLAHFLEHIAFLERLGMQFGHDINAYTSFDETVYQLDVPTDSQQTFDTAMNVLYEWAALMTLVAVGDFNSQEVEAWIAEIISQIKLVSCRDYQVSTVLGHFQSAKSICGP